MISFIVSHFLQSINVLQLYKDIFHINIADIINYYLIRYIATLISIGRFTNIIQCPPVPHRGEIQHTMVIPSS